MHQLIRWHNIQGDVDCAYVTDLDSLRTVLRLFHRNAYKLPTHLILGSYCNIWYSLSCFFQVQHDFALHTNNTACVCWCVHSMRSESVAAGSWSEWQYILAYQHVMCSVHFIFVRMCYVMTSALWIQDAAGWRAWVPIYTKLPWRYMKEQRVFVGDGLYDSAGTDKRTVPMVIPRHICTVLVCMQCKRGFEG